MKMVTIRMTDETNERSRIMALAQGISQNEFFCELANREYAHLRPVVLPSWLAISGLEEDVTLPDIDEKYAKEEKPRHIEEQEKKLTLQIARIRDAEDAWKATDTSDGTKDFVESLKNGEISVIDGKIVVQTPAKTTKTFPMINTATKTWIYDFQRRNHFKSLSLPNAIIAACGIEDNTDKIFTITDEDSGKIVVLREKFRISSGREMQIPAKFRSRIEKLNRVRIQYHG